MASDKAARTACGQAAYSQRHRLGIAFGRIVARSREEFGSYTAGVCWRKAGIWDKMMAALTIARNAAVQIIETFIVWVHQHGVCIGQQSGRRQR
jgi:hypothetical protein